MTTYIVQAGSYYYTPSSLTIERGDIVEWINDGGLHNVNGVQNSITGLDFNNPEAFSSGSTYTVGAVIYRFEFNIPGT